MSTRRRLVHATPEQVWDVLADGWLFPLWVVGAARMRDVDHDWPAAGAQLHHSVGMWPALVDDTTEVLESKVLSTLRLRARAWPGGEAEVVLRVTAQGEGTEVAITEQVVAGPGRLVPRPVRNVQLALRNDETLLRLALIAENRPGSQAAA